MSLPVEEQLQAYFTDLDHEQEAINLASIAAAQSSASGRLTIDAGEPGADRAVEVELDITPLEREETMTLKPSTLLLLAAAAVIVIAGVFFAIESGSDDSSPVISDDVPVSTTAAPQEGVSAAGSSEGAFTESNALGIVEAFYTAAEAGDADAIAATFAEASVVSTWSGAPNSGSADLAETLNVLVWDEAQGTIDVDRTCTASGAESASIVVVCGYGNHQYLQRVVDAPATPITETITVTADGIEEMDKTFAAPLFAASDAFNAWMRANYPEDAAAADCCGADGSIEEARADGELRRQYADLWAAYLGENGCTYTDIGC